MLLLFVNILFFPAAKPVWSNWLCSSELKQNAEKCCFLAFFSISSGFDIADVCCSYVKDLISN